MQMKRNPSVRYGHEVSRKLSENCGNPILKEEVCQKVRNWEWAMWMPVKPDQTVI